jgi:molybdenum cofactor cytidylyltransferase
MATPADEDGKRTSGGGRAAIVLAAGSSSRMGSPKALLPWANTTLIGYAVRELLVAGATTVVVVVGADADDVLAALPEHDAIRPVANPDASDGRSSSIRLGAAAVPPDSAAVIVQSVDQPCPASIVRALYQAAEQDSVDLAVPAFGGRRGHPICLSGQLLPELGAVSEESEGLRAVVRQHAHARVEVPVDNPIVHLNLNDRAAYERAREASAESGHAGTLPAPSQRRQ